MTIRYRGKPPLSIKQFYLFKSPIIYYQMHRLKSTGILSLAKLPEYAHDFQAFGNPDESRIKQETYP